MALKCGIVGLPQRGKIYVVQLLVFRKSPGAQLPVLHHRTQLRLYSRTRRTSGTTAALVNPKRVVPATVDFVDIAGLVKGASKGEGLATSSWPTSAKPMPSYTYSDVLTIRTYRT